MVDVTTDQYFPSATLAFETRGGAPATVDGVPVWASSDETVLTVSASADGLSAMVNLIAPGTARVTVTADADLGEGVRTIVGVSDDVNVTLGTSGQASVMRLNLGTPQDKPTA